MPRVASVARGCWAMDEEEPLWGAGLSWDFVPLDCTLSPRDWQQGTGSRSPPEQRVTPA